MTKCKSLFVVPMLLSSPAFAQYDLGWYTINGGGATFSTGGTFQLGATIGQPDAATPMTAGSFQLVGGFWPGISDTCTLPGDMNRDGQRDGLDVQSFVNCLIVEGACSCADMDGGGSVTSADAGLFVQALLS